MNTTREKYPEVAAMRARLSSFFAEDPEESLSGYLVRGVEDPLKPLTGGGRLRINPVLITLTAIVLLAVGVFLFFSFGQP